MKINLHKEILIDGRLIGEDHPPYLIAEMSANHNGQIESAIQLIEQAKLAGADAVKIQTYTADTITLNSNSNEFKIMSGPWAGKSLYDLYHWAHTPWEWHSVLFKKARDLGITLFSSPFDKTAIDFLEDLNCPAYKIASFEIIDLPLIKYAAKTGKPLIISTGMALKDEIEEAISAAVEGGCKDLVILRCVSGYPAKSSEFNLRTIDNMAKSFKKIIGLSDHTLSNVVALTAIGMGASIIEKHFTLNRNGGGADDFFSLEPEEFRVLCEQAREAWLSIGDVDYGPKPGEMESLKHRRSLYFISDLKSGDVITPQSVRSVRPGNGLPPKYIEQIIGKSVNCDIKKNSPVKFENIN
jgi:N-acetylneuraminate synthase